MASRSAISFRDFSTRSKTVDVQDHSPGGVDRQAGHPLMIRRAALQAGAVGLLGLGMGHLAEMRGLAAPARPRAKSVVFIFLSGGLSHLDSLDPKPEAPDSIRGPFKAIAT